MRVWSDVRERYGDRVTAADVREAVERVLDAHYAYLDKAPRDRPVDEREEGAWIASHTGLPEPTVLAVLAAHLDFLRDAGIARDV